MDLIGWGWAALIVGAWLFVLAPSATLGAVKERMVDVGRRARWTGSRALVVLSPDVCPSCGRHLDVERMHEPALIRHAGHGATRRSVRRHCSGCGWHLLAETTEERPAVTPLA